MEIPVMDKAGNEVGTMSVDEGALGGAVNPALIKQAFVMYHANRRQGSARTRGRGRVEGSGKKLFRQKGTGNARMGPKRTPIRKGGGHAFEKTKTREAYRQSMPVKMRRKANRNALLSKLLDGEVKVVDDMGFAEAKTKPFAAMIAALGVDRSCVVAMRADNVNGRLSARNVEAVSLCNSDQLTAWELMNHRYLVIGKSDLEAWLGGPSSKTGKSGSRVKKSKASSAGDVAEVA